jgi:hypothetical protein
LKLNGQVSSNKQAAVATATSGPKTVVNDTAVKTFLGECEPTMGDLLPTFERIGITNRECLRSVAKWPRAQLFLTLEKWKIAGMFNELQTESLKLAFDKLRTQTMNNEED